MQRDRKEEAGSYLMPCRGMGWWVEQVEGVPVLDVGSLIGFRDLGCWLLLYRCPPTDGKLIGVSSSKRGRTLRTLPYFRLKIVRSTKPRACDPTMTEGARWSPATALLSGVRVVDVWNWLSQRGRPGTGRRNVVTRFSVLPDAWDSGTVLTSPGSVVLLQPTLGLVLPRGGLNFHSLGGVCGRGSCRVLF